MRRLFLLLITKVKSLFIKSLSFSSRIEYSHISRKSKVWGHCKVFQSTVDDYSYIGAHCRVIHAHIGKFCSIAGDYSQIGMGKHSLDFVSTSSLFSAKKNGIGVTWSKKNVFDEYEDIFIGNDVWIGSSVKIMPGVHVGNGAVIGAGAIVTKDVPPYAIVGGVPAKIIKYRFPEAMINKIENSRWWELDDEILKKNISIFQENLNEDNISRLLGLCFANDRKREDICKRRY